jgi:hypothetical protein
MAGTSRKKGARLVDGPSLDAPLLNSRDQHPGVE